MPDQLEHNGAAKASAPRERAFLLRELASLIAGRKRAAVLALVFPKDSDPGLLKDVARAVRPFIRHDDVLAAPGDASLLMVLRGMAERNCAIGAARRLIGMSSLLQALEAPGGRPAPAFGIVMLPSELTTPAQIVQRAQRAARYALRTHARWVCWSDGPADLGQGMLSQDDLMAAQALRGLEGGEFELFFQPQLDTATGRLRGAEALARWRRNGELIMPGQFVPGLEARGLGGELGNWALRQACEHIARWRSQGLHCPKVAVNISAGQLRGDLIDAVLDALREHDVPPEQIELELTESADFAEPSDAAEVTRKLDEMGVHFSLDDFGSGYSSFLRLRSAPFTSVKLDREFVSGILTNNYDREMVRAVIGFCHTVEMQTVAEGVETPEQLQALRELGCDAWQGYLCARPMDGAALARFLQEKGPAPA